MPYSSRLIKATALLPDTKALMAAWDPSLDVGVNLIAAQENNIFGKASRSRVEDILRIFKQRYFSDPKIGEALVTLVQAEMPAKWIDPILYFLSAQNDETLRDIVLEVVNTRRQAGFTDIHVEHIVRKLRDWSAEGLTTSPWGEDTLQSVARHALATLRDFGILEGSNQKYLSPLFLPLESFILIAFILLDELGSGDRVLHSPYWELFNLKINDVEKKFFEAHQQHLCEYFSAGEVIRLEFPYKNLMELTNALIERSRP
jgi:hypothetical protein